LLYHGFVTNYSLIKPSDIILVDLVYEEIRYQLNYKYNHKHINSIKKHARHQKDLVDELRNKRQKRSRKAAYLALREYKYMIKGIADKIPAVRAATRREGDHDRIIAKTLAEFGRSHNVHLVLLTADDAMVDLCDAEGIDYFKFDMPHKIHDVMCSYTQMNELLFNLAVVFGFIKIDSIIAFGEFKEKTSNRPNELKLRFLNDELYIKYQKDQNICRDLLALNIS
jgi:hypothetical protein